MNPATFSLGTKLAAVALILGAVMSFVNGTAPIMGEQWRESIHPALASVRSRSTLSRAQLADRSMLAAIVLSGLAVVFEGRFLGLVVGIGLWMARPMIVRLCSQEHPLLAIGDSFSANLIIGLYLPVAIAQLLLGQVLTGAAMLSVVLALSWPAGGAARNVGGWRPAWQY